MKIDEKSYEDEIIEAALQGLKQSGTTVSDSFKDLLRLVYKAGYAEGIRNEKGFSGSMD